MFQRHLLAFLAVNLAIAAADLAISAGIQWAHWVPVAWGPILLLHALGLAARGHPITELLTPPRGKLRIESGGAPLEYELIRTRQLRDGVTNAAASVRDRETKLADGAVAVADELLSAVEALLESAKPEGRRGEVSSRLGPELRAAVESLDELHRGLLSVSIVDAPAEAVPIEAVRQRAQGLRSLSTRPSAPP